MLGGRTLQQIYELPAEGQSVRAIARLLGVERNSVRKYLRADEIPKAQPRPPRGSKLTRSGRTWSSASPKAWSIARCCCRSCGRRPQRHRRTLDRSFFDAPQATQAFVAD